MIFRLLMDLGLSHSTAIILFLANLALMVSSAPSAFRHILISLYTCLANLIACYVFRQVALGALEASPTGIGITSTRFAAAFQLEPLPIGQRQTLEVA